MENRQSIILVVDDNPTNLKLISDVLEYEGHLILKASTAEEAQLVIQGTLPELILLDIALVVALTASAMKGDQEKAQEAGCDGYITKPIDTRKLPGQVANLLERVRRANNAMKRKKCTSQIDS